MEHPDIDAEDFRARLLALRDELTAASQRADDTTVELDQQRQGRLSRIDAMGAQEMTKAAQRRRQQTLARLEDALQRIDTGDYGLCQSCDEPIDYRRLAFDPTVRYCITCASQAEGG